MENVYAVLVGEREKERGGGGGGGREKKTAVTQPGSVEARGQAWSGKIDMIKMPRQWTRWRWTDADPALGLKRGITVQRR